MRHPRAYCAAVLAVALLAPFAYPTDPPATKAKHSRKNEVTEVVQKTKAGVVAIRVPRQGERPMVGSGIIVDESGLVVTNRHVTGGKKTGLNIRLHDGSETTGDVVLTDADLDLAIIQIKTDKKLTALQLGPTDLMVGETVLAIGSPYGYDATVSRGIISAINREITMPNDVVMTGLIQTDAPINPGNSGGPLVNINSEVIGINVAMRDGAQNISFAINAGTVQRFLDRYNKKVASVKLGVKVEEQILGQDGDRQRVIVKHAAHAELKSGDEIHLIGDRKVANVFDLQRALWSKKPGQQVEVKVKRQGSDVIVRLTLEASQGAGSVAVVSPETPASNAGTAAIVRPASEQ